MNKILVVIPTYNHYKALEKMLSQLSDFQLDVLIVNDGSTQEISGKLASIAENCQSHYLSLSQNGGKGHAVKEGIFYANAHGYSHVIQVDADGQHDLSSLPVMIDELQKNPENLLLTKPIFDISNTPKARLWGRKISTFWIALETMSLDIKDGLCGFRGYPVKMLSEILSSEKIGNRMDFDPEILIFCKWYGMKISTIDTKVSYLDDEASNFRMFKDNCLISFVYMKLFWVGLFRSLFQKKPFNKKKWFTKKERGNPFVLK